MIHTLARRELRSLLQNPVAWTLLGVVQAVAAWLFLLQLEQRTAIQPGQGGIHGDAGVADLITAHVLGHSALVVLLALPFLSMNLLSREFSSGTFSLLQSAPISTTQITLGKYLGLLGFLCIQTLLLALMPLSLLFGGDIDIGRLIAGLLGLILVVAAAAAIGLYLSSLTSQPATAAALTYGSLLLLWIIENNTADTDPHFNLVEWLSLPYHFQFMLQGLVRASDLVYFAVLILIPLTLTVRQLEHRRLLF